MNNDALLQKQLKEAEKRVADGISATNLMASPEGKLIQDWVNERVSYLMEKLSATNPVDDREYLSIHGGIRELKGFNDMLYRKQRVVPNAQQDVKDIRGELGQ